MKLDIVYEDEYLIACIKPYGVPSQLDKTYGVDMITLVKEYLYEKACEAAAEAGQSSEDVEEPYVAVINRLDRPVAGIILFAKDETTAAKLSDMVHDRKIAKFYQVVVRGFMNDEEGTLKSYLLHDKKSNVTKVVPEGTKGAKYAELRYEVLDELDTDEGPISYLLVELVTGRHHQIRCQMAAEGAPIWGDTKYGVVKEHPRPVKGANGKKGAGNKNKGAKNKEKNEIGLYSTKMIFVHPITGEEVFLHREPEGMAFDIIDQVEW
jgi:Pseudouridylate synthases, 23S RNA-specific